MNQPLYPGALTPAQLLARFAVRAAILFLFTTAAVVLAVFITTI